MVPWASSNLSGIALLALAALPGLLQASSVRHFTTSAINLALLNESQVDTSVLGTHFDQWKAINGTAELRVERDATASTKTSGFDDINASPCAYTLTVTFQHELDDIPLGDVAFNGVCDPNATDPEANLLHTGQPVHLYQLNETVQNATGFDHVSVQYRPCGLRPLAVPRYDVVFYTVPMAYRALMTCELNEKVDALPRKCHAYQSNGRGRAHYSLPALAGSHGFVANQPVDLVADDGDLDLPAYPYEGLISSDRANIDVDLSDPSLNLTETPAIEISTYDGSFVSFRMVLPATGVVGSNDTSTLFSGSEYYVYPTLPSLPSSYNVGYRFPTRTTSIHLRGRSGTCQGAQDATEPDSNSNTTGSN